MDNSDVQGRNYTETGSRGATGGNGVAGAGGTAGVGINPASRSYGHAAPSHSPAGDLANQALAWARDHPMLTVAVVAAAVVAIGPRRIMHSVENAASSGGAMTSNVTNKLRDPSTVDNLTKLLTTLTTVLTTASNFLQQVKDAPRR